MAENSGVDTAEYLDKTLVCLSCGAEFEFPAEQQRELAARGFNREPRRCAACDEQMSRTRKPVRRRPPPPTQPMGRRAFYPAVCSTCGQSTQVPFQPKPGRPVYCRQCFAAGHAGAPPRAGTRDTRYNKS